MEDHAPPLSYSPEPLEVDVDVVVDGGLTIVTIVGEVDLATAPQLQKGLAAIPDGARVAVVDLSGASFLDSTGIGLLVGAWKRLGDGDKPGELRLVVTSRGIRRVLEATGLAGAFSIYEEVEKAVEK